VCCDILTLSGPSWTTPRNVQFTAVSIILLLIRRCLFTCAAGIPLAILSQSGRSREGATMFSGPPRGQPQLTTTYPQSPRGSQAHFDLHRSRANSNAMDIYSVTDREGGSREGQWSNRTSPTTGPAHYKYVSIPRASRPPTPHPSAVEY
jgi:hypothetical protein